MSKKDRQIIKIVLNGADGRVGSEVQLLLAANGFKAAALVKAGKDWAKVKASEVDVVIDFSQPAGLLEALEWCVKNKIALVSGTTGLAPADFKKLELAAKKIPLLHSANMSVGIAVMNAMLEKLERLKHWDFQIEEVHHIHKKDRPSGTALLMQKKLEKILAKKIPEATVVRGGGVPGIHKVWALGPDETLVLEHTAFQRRVFAQGALYAARWLFDKDQPGLYDLSDLYK